MKIKMEIKKDIIGKRIKMISMNDPLPIMCGDTGVVSHIDDIGQIHVKWDNGRTLAVIPEEDDFEIIG